MIQIYFHGIMQLSGKLLMHFKPFWMPCLHIKFFTSTPIPELIAVKNFTKRWNGILASHSGILCRTSGAQGFPLCHWSRLWQCTPVWGVSSHMRGNLEPRLIRSKKSSCQTWLESRDQKWGEKSACQIRSRVSRRSQAFRISFFFAAAPQISCRTKHLSGIYMLPDFIFS